MKILSDLTSVSWFLWYLLDFELCFFWEGPPVCGTPRAAVCAIFVETGADWVFSSPRDPFRGEAFRML